jgi:hypothetical protein
MLMSDKKKQVVLISPKHATLQGLCAEISSISGTSPNCQEFMSKFKKTSEDGPAVEELRVHWNGQSHDPKIFPASTILTEQNFEAVVKMIGQSGVGRDTLQVKMMK